MPRAKAVDPVRLIPVSVITLRPAVAVPCDLFLIPSGGRPLLFGARNQTFSAEELARLAGREVTRLYIRPDERGSYQSYLHENMQDWLEDESLSALARVSVLHDVMRDVLATAFASGSAEVIVREAKALGQQAAALVAREEVMFREVVRVLHHDYTTFTHSANVSMYAVMLARSVGVADGDLQEIAVGALLHDVGKLDIDPGILTKEGRLEESETRQMRRHPTVGLRKLSQRRDLSMGQLMMVYQHHERLDGRGYPVGVEADEIHPWARICTVADVFEALTSQRPYRRPMSSSAALALMERDTGKAFDPEVFQCWKRLSE